jgi:hypothetical protein
MTLAVERNVETVAECRGEKPGNNDFPRPQRAALVYARQLIRERMEMHDMSADGNRTTHMKRWKTMTHRESDGGRRALPMKRRSEDPPMSSVQVNTRSNENTAQRLTNTKNPCNHTRPADTFKSTHTGRSQKGSPGNS